MTTQITLFTTTVYAVAGCLLALALHRYRHAVFRGIPDLSATAMALFRIAFSVALYRAMTVSLDLPRTPAPGGPVSERALWEPWAWIEYLTQHADLRDALQTLTIIAIVAFGVGLFARAAYVVVAIGFIVRLLVAQEYGAVSHAWVLYPFALLPLMIVPWGDGLSLDNVIRQWRGRPKPPRPAGPHYGIAVWLPGLTLGCVWLAAAGAKLAASGAEWILGGAVRYHWAEDHLAAPTSWGAWIASHEALSVMLSGAGVAFEALFITHVLFRSECVRLVYGLVALSLLGGFYFFQGVFWYAWWTILLGFVPWELIVVAGRRFLQRWHTHSEQSSVPAVASRPRSLRALSPAIAVVASALLTQQAAISRAAVEQMPFFSHYPMYAYTWHSPDEFNKAIAPRKFYRYEILDIGRRLAPRNITHRLEVVNAIPVLQDAVLWVRDHPERPLPSSLRRSLEAVRESYEQRFRDGLLALRIVTHRRVFDFAEGKLATAGNIAPVSVSFSEGKVSVSAR